MRDAPVPSNVQADERMAGLLHSLEAGEYAEKYLDVLVSIEDGLVSEGFSGPTGRLLVGILREDKADPRLRGLAALLLSVDPEQAHHELLAALRANSCPELHGLLVCAGAICRERADADREERRNFWRGAFLDQEVERVLGTNYLDDFLRRERGISLEEAVRAGAGMKGLPTETFLDYTFNDRTRRSRLSSETRSAWLRYLVDGPSDSAKSYIMRLLPPTEEIALTCYQLLQHERNRALFGQAFVSTLTALPSEDAWRLAENLLMQEKNTTFRHIVISSMEKLAGEAGKEQAYSVLLERELQQAQDADFITKLASLAVQEPTGNAWNILRGSYRHFHEDKQTAILGCLAAYSENSRMAQRACDFLSEVGLFNPSSKVRLYAMRRLSLLVGAGILPTERAKVQEQAESLLSSGALDSESRADMQKLADGLRKQ